MSVGQCTERETIVSNDTTFAPEIERPRIDRVAIPITLHNPKSLLANVPLTFGVDVPRGMVSDSTRLIITDEHGRRPTVQQMTTARWPDGSAKWILVDFSAESVPRGTSFWSVSAVESAGDASTSDQPTPKTPIVHVVGSVLEVDHPSLGSGAKGPVQIDFQLRNQHRDLRKLRTDSVDWETIGPVRSTLRVEGTFARCRGLRLVARIHVYQKSDLIEVSARLHNPNRAKHKGGLWDLGDAGSILFHSFDVVINAPKLTDRNAKSTCWWQCEAESALRRDATGGVTIYQDSSGGQNWQSRVHLNRNDEVRNRFRGYRVTAGDEKWSGLRATPIVKVCTSDMALEVAVPEFWEQFPSAIESEAGSVRVGMFPGQFGDVHELQAGEQKTQKLWLRISPDGTKTPAVKTLQWVHQRPRVTISPEWHRATKAIPYFVSATNDPDSFVRSSARSALHGKNSLFARREVIDEYGWRNFGEMWADHEQPADSNGHVISHYNNQFDVIYGGLLQMLRSGDPGWFDLWEPLARHVADIDIYHTDMDRAAYNGGLFWHTDHYKTADRCTHRTYSAANQKSGQMYGGGPSDEHNYTTGLLHAYYLTGNPDFKDAVLSLANWVVNMDDGEQTVFAVASDGATGLASATAQPDYDGPGRGAGNSVNSLIDGWLLTNDDRYLRYAEVIIRRVVNPSDEIDSLDLLNSELRWSYTVFLTALARYLHVKADANEKDNMYAYAAYSLTHYGRWMTEHERPYLDHPEELEYPTETWAAQDLRKANVLRLAARYMSGRHRDAALRRGDEIAERARRDLCEFESSDLIRPLNLILTEGAKDCFMRTYGPGKAALCQSFEFVPPAGFEPQKQAAVRRLKSVSGACAVAGRMLDVRRWRRLLRAAMAR